MVIVTVSGTTHCYLSTTTRGVLPAVLQSLLKIRLYLCWKLNVGGCYNCLNFPHTVRIKMLLETMDFRVVWVHTTRIHGLGQPLLEKM